MEMKDLKNRLPKRSRQKKTDRTEVNQKELTTKVPWNISALRHRYTEKLTYANKAPNPRGYLKHKGPQDVAD